ncbi:hypothetical protein [Pseudozobellia sp. WGM2]|uniref:hypothetical protein n=1 Tax=Pseudozobellia sp. WGM2 TaxID=2787625 RepID=UPI001AE01B0F|nr:hypothetical protein [Pseudozobellia sp. WGM2]
MVEQHLIDSDFKKRIVLKLNEKKEWDYDAKNIIGYLRMGGIDNGTGLLLPYLI